MNEIHTDRELVLPDLQRDFVWREDQIRLLMDSIMCGYPFGSLLFWQTRFLEVPYREFVREFEAGQRYVTQLKPAGQPMEMVLDGQQRLQALYIGVFGSHSGRRLYFNVTSGRGASEASDDELEAAGGYRFEFWREDEPKRPKRLVRVSNIVAWLAHRENEHTKRVIDEIELGGEEAQRAESNMKLLRSVMSRSDLVPVETIDDDAFDEASARTTDEILEIFVPVNTGGTRRSRSDLMFSLLKRQWGGARRSFDDLLEDVEKETRLGVDKDFIIPGLLTVADAPPVYDVANIRRHWEEMVAAFDGFAGALRSAIDFCRGAEVGILSASLLNPIATLFPIVYFLYHQPNGSVPDEDRKALPSFLYLLLFNRFVKSEARIRYLRSEIAKAKGKRLALDALVKVIIGSQKYHYVESCVEMLNSNPDLALNIAQPRVCRETLSWQERAEVDHIFPQSVYRPRYPALVDDIGDFAYLGKLRNIRKSAEPPWEYFAGTSDRELADDYVIDDRRLLADDRFEEFVEARRAAILTRVRAFLGR